MSTVRSIERRLYVRRQMDRDLGAQAGAAPSPQSRAMEWGAIWTGYMVFVGVAVLLLSFVFGVGFSSLKPLQGSSWASMGSGVAIWSVIVVLVSMFIGSWISARHPVASKRHGMMRGITLWGLVMLTALVLTGWVTGTAVSATSGVAGSALSSASNAGVAALQGVLQGQGINISNDQAAAVSAQLVAGDHTGAATTLATDANIPTSRANTVLSSVATPAAGAAQGAASGVKAGGSTLSWGLFWLALIGLGCALLGGSIGAAGGAAGGDLLRRHRNSPQPA